MKQVSHRVLPDIHFSREFSNGFKVSLYKKPNYLEKAAYLIVNYGSYNTRGINEKGEVRKFPDGVAHFLEHKLFENTSSDLFTKMGSLGADVNAFTSYSKTVYYFYTSENFLECLDLLLNVVVKPEYTQKGIDEEVSIISREIDMYLDDDSYFGYNLAMSNLYKDHPFGKDIAGTKESIKEIDKDILDEIMKGFYTPSNMHLVLVGDIDENLLENIQERLPDFYKNEVFTYKSEVKEVENQGINEFIHVERDVYPSFSYVIKNNIINGDQKQRLKETLSTRLALSAKFSEVSKFYRDAYSEGLFTRFNASIGRENNVIVFSGETNQPRKLFERINRELETEVLDEDFELIKKSIISDFLMFFSKVSNMIYIDIMLDGTDIHPFEYEDFLLELENPKYIKINGNDRVVTVVGGQLE